MNDSKEDNTTQEGAGQTQSLSNKVPKKRVSEQTVPKAALLAAFCGSLAFSLLIILIATRLINRADPLNEVKQNVETPVTVPVLSDYRTIDKDSLGYLTINEEETVIKDAFARLIPYKQPAVVSELWNSQDEQFTEVHVALYTEALSAEQRLTLEGTPSLIAKNAQLPEPLIVLELKLPYDSLSCDPTFISDGFIEFNTAHPSLESVSVPGSIRVPISPSLLHREGSISLSCPLLESGQPLTLGYRYKEPISELPGYKVLWNVYLEKPLIPVRYLAEEYYRSFKETLAIYHQNTNQLEIGYYPTLLSKDDKRAIATSGSLTAVASKHPDAIANIPIDISKTSKLVPLNRDMVKSFYTLTFYDSAEIKLPPRAKTLRYISRGVPQSLGGSLKKGSLITARLEGEISESHAEGLYTLGFTLSSRSPLLIVDK